MSTSLTGQQIQAAVYAHTSITPADIGVAIIALSYTVLILSTIIVFARIWVLVAIHGEQSLGWKSHIHDYLAILGYMLFVPSLAMAIKSAYYGMGAKDDKIDDLLKIRAAELFIDFEIIYFFASTVTKFAIAFTTYRICVQRIYRQIIITNVIVMTSALIISVGIGLGNCTPLAATWNPALGHCRWADGFTFVSYFGTAFQILTDWVSAIIPALIIKDLQIRPRLKVSLVFVLSVGGLASIAVVIRMFYYKYFDTVKYPNDYLFHLGITLILSISECGLGVMACSLPPLHKLFVRFLNPASTKRKTDPSADVSGGIELGSRGYKKSNGSYFRNKGIYNDETLLRTEMHPVQEGETGSNEQISRDPASNGIWRETRIDLDMASGRGSPAPTGEEQQSTSAMDHLSHSYMADWDSPKQTTSKVADYSL